MTMQNKRVLHINSMPCGSTGKIMFGIGGCAEQDGMLSFYSFPEFDGKGPLNLKKCSIIIGNRASIMVSHILGRITGMNNCFSFWSTKKFIKKIKEVNPNIIHLHNLHNCYLNLSMFFNFIKKTNIPVVWTLHDCWAFTADCPYFDLIQCNKWTSGCNKCPQLNIYPKSYIDSTSRMYKIKKQLFSGINKMTLVTPSIWLNKTIQKSFLSAYPTKIISNGIDIELFKRRNSNLKNSLGLEGKFVILGVAQKWGIRKGLDIFIELYNNLPKEQYTILLVGTDKECAKQIPQEIICIERTNDQQELAEFYSMSDVFVNPTREEMFGLVNIESLACGTPVITFDSGGSAESIDDTCGIILKKKDTESIMIAIKKIRNGEIIFNKNECRKKAEAYDEKIKYKEYVKLYRSLI